MKKIGHCYDLTGKRFGKLVAVKLTDKRCCEKPYWLCKCDCGNEKLVLSTNLTQGKTRSCGCMEHAKRVACRPLTLNQRRIRNRSMWLKKFPDSEIWQLSTKDDRLYYVWESIVKRCYNQKSKDYYLYGGRGIGMCQEWRDYFCEFKAWALDNGYDYSAAPFDCTIDRINVNGNYEPSNCRFVDMKTQIHNRRPQTCGK